MVVIIPVLALKCNEVEVEPAQNNHVELSQASSHTKNMAIKASNNFFYFFTIIFGIFDNLLFEFSWKFNKLLEFLLYLKKRKYYKNNKYYCAKIKISPHWTTRSFTLILKEKPR